MVYWIICKGEKMFSLEENISGNNFIQLLDICFGLSSYLSLTKPILSACQFDVDLCDKIAEDMVEFKIKTIYTRSWFSYVIYEGTVPKNIFEIYIFKANEQTKEIIKKYYNNLFFDIKDIEERRKTIMLEDICFFKNKKLFLGTVSHEYICSLYTDDIDDENKSKLLSLAKWKEKKDRKEEQIIIDI